MRRIWAGVGAAVLVGAGAAGWAVATHTDLLPGGTGTASATSHAFDNVDNAGRKTDALLESGLLQLRYQDLRTAKATFERVLELDPGNKLAWYNLGVLAQQENRRADALKAYDAALKTDPAYTSALFNKALLLEADDPGEALALLRRAVRADPKASTAHFHIGAALARQGRDAQARDAYRRAVELDTSLRPHVPEPFRPAAPASSGSSSDPSDPDAEDPEDPEDPEGTEDPEDPEDAEDRLDAGKPTSTSSAPGTPGATITPTLPGPTSPTSTERSEAAERSATPGR
ncbi:tetratricopeptide repeat protein [Streptomyces sp. JNUCC 64]